MKSLSTLSLLALLSCISCNNANQPVQTASDLTPEETPGSTSIKADSVTTAKQGPDQMVPENTGPTVDSTMSKNQMHK